MKLPAVVASQQWYWDGIPGVKAPSIPWPISDPLPYLDQSGPPLATALPVITLSLTSRPTPDSYHAGELEGLGPQISFSEQSPV